MRYTDRMNDIKGISIACYGFWFVGLLLIVAFTRDVPSLYLAAPLWVPLALVGALSVLGWIADMVERPHQR